MDYNEEERVCEGLKEVNVRRDRNDEIGLVVESVEPFPCNAGAAGNLGVTRQRQILHCRYSGIDTMKSGS